MTDDSGTDTRRSHLTAREAGYLDGKRDALASAVARGAAHARLVEAARRIVAKMRDGDDPKAEFRALDAALAEVDRG